MQKTALTALLAATCAICLTAICLAAVPAQISYQGRLTNLSGQPFDTTEAMTFLIYSDSLGSTVLWSEVHPAIKITDGLFHALIGSVSPIPAGVFDGTARWLGIQVGSSATAMTPVPIVTVAYAYRALKSDTSGFASTVADNAITSSKIANGAIQFADIGQNWASVGEVIKWSGSGWSAEADAVRNSGWTDNGKVVSLTSATDTVALNTSLRLGTLNLYGNIGLTEGSSVFFGTDSTRIQGFGNGDVHVECADFFMDAREDIRFGLANDAYWVLLDNSSKRLGIGALSTLDEMLHLENNESGGRAFLKVETSHATGFGEAGIRFKTPQNTWHLRMDDVSNNNMAAGALGLRSQSGGEAVTWEESGDESHHNNTIKSYHGFPKPDYDSGWRTIAREQRLTLTHGLGGDPNDYVVDMQFVDVDSTFGRHIKGYGGDMTRYFTGISWEDLNASTVKVYREQMDYFCDQVRIRIWVISE